MAVDITKRLVRNFLGLKKYDYSQPGAYFMTICTDNRICYFGNVVDGIMISFTIIEAVREIWLEIPKRFQCIDLDAFIIMPNHIHGIIIINKEGSSLIRQTHKINYRNNPNMRFINQSPIKTNNWILTENSQQMVGKIIRYFKAKSSKIIHESGFQHFRWQRNYYEHVVRSAIELDCIREYIINNPVQWELDRENCLSRNFNIDLGKYFRDVFEK